MFSTDLDAIDLSGLTRPVAWSARTGRGRFLVPHRGRDVIAEMRGGKMILDGEERAVSGVPSPGGFPGAPLIEAARTGDTCLATYRGHHPDLLLVEGRAYTDGFALAAYCGGEHPVVSAAYWPETDAEEFVADLDELLALADGYGLAAAAVVRALPDADDYDIGLDTVETAPVLDHRLFRYRDGPWTAWQDYETGPAMAVVAQRAGLTECAPPGLVSEARP